MSVSPPNPQSPIPEVPSELLPQSVPTASTPFSAFTKREKWIIVTMTGVAGIFSPISGAIYFPAIPTIANEFNTSISLINLTVTVYMIAQGVSPVIWAPFADVYGRRPVFIACLSLLAVSCIALAVIPTSGWWLLLVLRIFQSSGSASTIALAGGVISDIATPAERGGYLGITTLGAMLGPCIGPILGGILAGQLGWRWIFWFLCILTGVCLIPMVLFFPETLRFVVGDGSIAPPLWNRPLIPIIAPWQRGPSDEYSKPPSSAAKRPRMNPLPLFRNLDVLLTLFSGGLAYALFMTVPAVISALFQDAYPYLTETKIGLCFLPIGIAGIISGFVSGKIADRAYKAERAKYDANRKQRLEADSESVLKEEEEWAGDQFAGFHIEKARLKLSFPYIALMMVSVIGFGWCLKAKVSLAGPLVFEVGLGWSCIAIMNGYQLLLIDLYPKQGSSVVALSNVVRCTLGAILIAIIDPILNAMGTGWTFVFFGLIVGVLAPLMTWVVIWRGPQWRKARAKKARCRAEARDPDTEEKSSPSS
ncbi:hypothetical protein M407DRAFT_210543 [Tulasnella calospora MUT 4182]|uniref:Major facilitator superfamily (MFS) profile domain-containing protein n=1 Tax=Tulasnella calospora MUT 4182 TaxID=1051891 RepID=A0A0C3QI02_9AGAM|nr:hypothetical protein M407DRAFT_210543 [Tulasnella calospora MUT 4182]